MSPSRYNYQNCHGESVHLSYAIECAGQMGVFAKSRHEHVIQFLIYKCIYSSNLVKLKFLIAFFLPVL